MLLKLQKPPEVKGYGQGGEFQIQEETKEEASLAQEETGWQWQPLTVIDENICKSKLSSGTFRPNLKGPLERPAAFDKPDAMSPGCIVGEHFCPSLPL